MLLDGKRLDKKPHRKNTAYKKPSLRNAPQQNFRNPFLKKKQIEKRAPNKSRPTST